MPQVTQDRAFWQSIVQNDYALPEGYAAEEFIPVLLEFLASPDGVLRDEFGYMVSAHWMVKRLLSPDAMKSMIPELRARLTQGIGEIGTDGVFARSFAAVILGQIVNEDNKQDFLTSEEIHELLDDALTYLAAENDLRGYVVGNSWAHSTAHTADLLWFLTRSDKINGEDLKRILDAIGDKFLVRSGYTYVHGEDERIARAIVTIFYLGKVSIEAETGWIEHLIALTDEADPAGGFDPLLHSAYFNVKNLLRSVYLKIRFNESQLEFPHGEVLKETLFEGLKKFNQ